MANKRKYKKGDIVYSIDVYENLVVNVNKLIVTDYFDNEQGTIYKCIGLENEIIREYENSEGNNCAPGKTISSSAAESALFLKEELKEKIKEHVDKRVEQNKRIQKEQDEFRCPLTKGRLILSLDRFIFASYTSFKVEGFDHEYTRSHFDWDSDVYHTKFKGEDYSFKYLGNGRWKEVVKILGKAGNGIYVDKFLYELGSDEVLSTVKEFLEKEEVEFEKREERRKKAQKEPLLPIAKKVSATTKALDLVSVKPMSTPSGNLFYMTGPEREKIFINIKGEGQYEFELEEFERWRCEVISPGVYQLGTTIITIEQKK